MLPDAGPLDESGEPRPPKTWSEFYRVARIITEYGRRAPRHKDLDHPLCYGVVIQGQRAYDPMRGIKPLAARVGSSGFNFEGKRHVLTPDRRAG